MIVSLDRLKAEADAAKAEADKKKAEKKAKKKKAKEAKEGEEEKVSSDGDVPPTEAPPAGNGLLLDDALHCCWLFLIVVEMGDFFN